MSVPRMPTAKPIGSAVQSVTRRVYVNALTNVTTMLR